MNICWCKIFFFCSLFFLFTYWCKNYFVIYLRRRHQTSRGETGEVGSSTREKKVPARRSVSFKEGATNFWYVIFVTPISDAWLIFHLGLTSYYVCLVDKKKSSSWLQKQFMRQMSDQGYDPISEMDHAAAVAATAYAITTFEETWLESYHVIRVLTKTFFLLLIRVTIFLVVWVLI